MRTHWICAIVALVIGVAFASVPALAQTTGTIEGTVLDAGASPLPGATVEIRSPSLLGMRNTVADNGGHYRFPALPPGTYARPARPSTISTTSSRTPPPTQTAASCREGTSRTRRRTGWASSLKTP